MKKYVCLLLFAIMLNGCDDGDLTAETIDFSEIDPVNCSETNELLYKLKDQEALLLQLPKFTFSLENGIPEVGTGEYDITAEGPYKLVYKAYDGTISSSNICDAIRPSLPNISNEWFATGGKMEIKTTANIVEDTDKGSSKITGFNHAIYMKNITYSKPQGTQVGPDFFYGNFLEKNYTSPDIVFVNEAGECSTTKQLYNYTSTSSMTIDNVDPKLIVNEETVGTPRKSVVTSTQNKLVYNNYINGTITSTYFCNATGPTSLEINEIWNGAIDGIIEVTTSKSGTTFTHTITLKNVVLVNGNLTFKLGNSFSFGVLTKQ